MAFGIPPSGARKTSEQGSARQRGEQLAAILPPLLVEAERIAATVAQGVHGRRRVGPGETFWQFRQYQQGDDASTIDWRQSARSMRSYVRESEWEAAQSVWLWRDASVSMDYQSTLAPCTKADRATVLLLAVAALLLRGEERVGLLGHDRLARTGRTALDHLAAALLLDHAGDRNQLPVSAELPRHAKVVMIGDMLSPVADIDALVRSFAARGIAGHILQVLDPAEEELPFNGRTLFLGPEDEGAITVGRVESLRHAYLDRLQARHDSLTAMARASGWTFSVHRTDKPPQTALLALYAALSGVPL